MRTTFRLLLAAAAAAASTTTLRADPPQVGTVFVIALENHNWTQPNPTASPQQIFGNPAAPYINSLVTPGNPNAAQVSYTTNYLNAGTGEHPSEPNYVWAEAGTNFNPSAGTTPTLTTQGTIVGNTILNDSDPTAANNNILTNVPHLTAQLNNAGISWNNYQEDYQISSSTNLTGGTATVSKSGTSTLYSNPYYSPLTTDNSSNSSASGQYNYAVKHNPMAFFTDTATQNVYTFDKLRSDITADTGASPVNNFGRYNWITPNQYNDMHSSLNLNFTYAGQTWTHNTDQEAIAIGDNFLATIVPQIMATQAYKNNGAIVIWFDESENGDSTAQTIPEIVISPLAKGNAYTNTIDYSHSSDIKTMEELFGLPQLNNPIPSSETYAGGGYATVSGATDLSDLFVAGAVPAPEPASLAVLALGGVTLLARRRSR